MLFFGHEKCIWPNFGSNGDENDPVLIILKLRNVIYLM